MALFFKTIDKAKITAGHIAGLLEGLKMDINMIITYYKRAGTDSKGNLGTLFLENIQNGNFNLNKI